MPLDTHYKPDEPKIAVEDFDGEFVVLNLDSGQYFSFAETSALLWQGLASGLSPNQLLSDMIPTSERCAVALAFIQQVIDARLVVPMDAPPHGALENFSFQIAQSDGSISFEAFDDLAALLVADPIHEVEREAGWPHKAPE